MKFITFYILIFITVLSCNYQQKEEIEENIVAKVNNDFLTLEELRSNFTEERWNELTLDEKREFINDWIQLSLLAQESERLKLDKRMEIKSRIKTAEKTVKSNALIAQKISEIVITEDDLFNYYKLHKSKFQKKTKEFRVQRIFIKRKSKLDSVLVYIKNGLPFTEAAKMYSEEKIGAEILKAALQMPLYQIAKNAGVAGDVVVERLKNEKNPNIGYNAAKREYSDLMADGVIDPAKVTRSAVQNACSIAGLFLTTECIISDIPKKEEPMPSMPPGGYGGGMY